MKKKSSTCYKKTKIQLEIEKINKIMDTLDNTNKEIEHITETMIICGNKMVDNINFSILSLPSTKKVFRNL